MADSNFNSDFCGNPHLEAPQTRGVSDKLGKLLEEKILKKRENLKTEKELRSSPPYIQYSTSRTDEFEYIPIIFHVFEAKPHIENSIDGGAWPTEEIHYMVSKLNEYLAGTLTYTANTYEGPAQGRQTKYTSTYQEGGAPSAEFVAPVEHSDHGVEANFKYVIPDKLRISDLYASEEFDNDKLDVLLADMSLPSQGYEDAYISGGTDGIIFRYPYYVWSNSEKLTSLHALGPNKEDPIFQNIPGVHVCLNSPTSTFPFGGIGTFPWNKCNFVCTISGGAHHRADVAVEVLFHELGHNWGLSHTHQNSRITKLEGGASEEGENSDISFVERHALSAGVTFYPPTYKDEDTNASVPDLQPLPTELKEYVEFLYNDLGKFHYSYLPTLRKKIGEYIDTINSQDLVDVFLEEFGYPPGQYSYGSWSNSLKNTGVPEGASDGIEGLVNIGINTISFGDYLSKVYFQNDNLGVPFWGGSQAYDSAEGKNVLVINPAGPSEEEVGDVYSADSSVGLDTPTIGDNIDGGIVFYVNEENTHVLIAALEDIEGTYEWGCFGTDISGADGQAIGTGLQNTLDIVARCPETPIASSEALAYESEGYSDWYLPSIDELLEMYNTIGQGASNVGSFDDALYWSSSEYNNYLAWCVLFSSGATGTISKYNSYRVRVIRSSEIINTVNRRGPNVTMRIPFCKLDIDGNQTNEYDPLWAINYNYLNPIYPAYPDNYPVADWNNLTNDLCPCINQLQSFSGSETIGGTTSEYEDYMPKEVSIQQLRFVVSQEFLTEFGHPLSSGLTLNSSIMGNLTNISKNGWTPLFYEDDLMEDTLTLPTFLYYGFSPFQANRPKHYDPTLGELVLPGGIAPSGTSSPGTQYTEEVVISSGYVTGANYMPDLNKFSSCFDDDGGVPFQAHLGQASYYMTGSRNELSIGEYTDFKGNLQTINLQNPLKVLLDINLNPVAAPIVVQTFKGVGDYGFDPDFPHVDLISHYTSAGTWDFPYKNQVREILGFKFEPRPFKIENHWNSPELKNIRLDNFIHPGGVLEGAKLDGYSEITYLDLTNSMQYLPKFKTTSYDHLEDTLNTIITNPLIPTNSYNIGDEYEGGIIFQLNEDGTGLVAALEDLGEFEWGCFGSTVSGANGQSIGTGYQNTAAIVSNGCTTEDGGLTAAAMSSAYGSDGYTDWYLPSLDELVEMYNTIGNGGPEGNIGGFENNSYWSSSENSNSNAWGVNFINGVTFFNVKYLTYRVRVIRDISTPVQVGVPTTYMEKHAEYFVHSHIKSGVYDLILKNYSNINSYDPVNSSEYLPEGIGGGSAAQVYDSSGLSVNIPHAPSRSGLKSVNKASRVWDSELELSCAGGARVTYSPEQIAYIESYIEYAKVFISYSEASFNYPYQGTYSLASPRTVNLGEEGEVQAFGWGIHPDSIKHAIERLRDLMIFSHNISLSSETTSYTGDNDLATLLRGGNLTVRECDFTSTSYIPTIVNLNSSPENSRGVDPKDPTVEDSAVEYTTEGPFYTYGNEFYTTPNTSYVGYYYSHSIRGLQEGDMPADGESLFNKPLKSFAELPRTSATYKNLMNKPKKFIKIYNTILKNL